MQNQEQEVLRECSHKFTRSHFVKQAKEDNISKIHYNVVFFMNDLFKKSYLGVNTIQFEYNGDEESQGTLKIAFQGTIFHLTVNGKIIAHKIAHSDGLYINIDKSTLSKGTNSIIVAFKMDYNLLRSDKKQGTGAFKYKNDYDQQFYVYTQCEPDFTQQILPVFYNLNHKAVFKLGFITQSKHLVVSNMNIEKIVDFKKDVYLETVRKQDPELTLDDDLVDEYLTVLTKSNNILCNQLKHNTAFFTTFWKYLIFLEEDPENISELQYREFEDSPKISFNLMTFAIGPYLKFQCKPHREIIPVEFYCQRGSEELMRQNVDRLEQVTLAGLKYYEEYLKTPYPFTKYGNLFAPYFSFNAMENPGLVLINQKNLLSKGKKYSYWDVINRDRMLLHEMAHMWMGNLFTMDEWHGLWLKEGTAEIFCHKSFAAILEDEKKYGLSTEAFGSEDIWINFVIRTALNNNNECWPFNDKNSFAVCFKEEKYFDRMIDFYGTIVYQKCSSYLKNLEFLIGSERFRQLFVEIIATYSYSNLNSQNFLDILLHLAGEESYGQPGHLQSGETLQDVCQKWYDHHIHIKGYPIAMVNTMNYDEESKTFKFTLKVLHGKWTRVRTLLVGDQGQTQEVILTINPEAQSELIQPESRPFQFVFENVKFRPSIILPNYKFDDFMHVAIHPEHLYRLFVSLPELPKPILEEKITLAYINQYTMHFKSNYTCLDSTFWMKYLAVYMNTTSGYFVERTQWVQEMLTNTIGREKNDVMVNTKDD